ncbi:tRNA synthetases class II-domain-containing protein [Pseudomassariella vexata]|uniref:tRNA synthetases class II-domain-containing protein n=1 Tax=Pseudomassariella vexata TaxID=1141098 RepID=A0A1Y2DFM0_9PEZI|nr:tRNA synthetases class II-domain-containing protein [Pseudomassariella vexata]ORY57894.1 tRNA synthetases class II-domain-containing protein [Pseudomassariella vexata]
MPQMLSNNLRLVASHCISGIGRRPPSRLYVSGLSRLPSPWRRYTHDDASKSDNSPDGKSMACCPSDPETRARLTPPQSELERSRTPLLLPSQEPEVENESILLTKSPESRLQRFREAFEYPQASPEWSYKAGREVTVHGWLGKPRVKGSKLIFCDLSRDQGNVIQIVSSLHQKITSGSEELTDDRIEAHKSLRSIPAQSPVAVTGILEVRPRRVEETSVSDALPQYWDLKLNSIQCLNPFPNDIIVSQDAVWSPKQRHLQMRFDPLLRDRLRFRSSIAFRISKALRSLGFTEVETPMLFKSTPEGAREFLVPTRRAGYTYALPQSPQQYKQILMAGGVPNYFQFARCFRDEDLRADRQPEFTQLDLEMSFASGREVMTTVQSVMSSVFRFLHDHFVPTDVNGVTHPVHSSKKLGEFQVGSLRYPANLSVPVRTYDEVMSKFGVDKPDLRIPSDIVRIDSFLPTELVSMISKLKDPIVDAAQFRLQGSPSENLAFIREFMDNLPKTSLKFSGDSTPGVFVIDEAKPLNGLSAFGHEAAEKMAAVKGPHWHKLQDGDVLIVQARKKIPFHGEGSTDLGRLRKAIYDAAVEKGLLPRDHSFRFLWVTEFPLFTPNDPQNIAPGEGQGGRAGFSATHHPFTAPLSAKDFALLETDPLSAKADHYDLVCNGVEIGGGSRRIHIPEIQEYVMRHVLQMPQEGVDQFAHLLEALRAGCPPHAGFALGFDRLIAVLCDTESVRDVIAFPKNMKGEDMFVKSPTKVTDEQLATYHLKAS